MNERLKELAEQANIRFGRMAILDGDPRGMARFVSYSEFEKFAELIVRECLFIIDDERKSDMVSRTELWHQIREHFGVEE